MNVFLINEGKTKGEKSEAKKQFTRMEGGMR